MRTDSSVARGSVAVRRALETELEAAASRTGRPRVVDVGGGSGVWAVRFAAAGCLVTVVEPNHNALATLRRRAAEEGVADRITAIADDSDSLGAHVPAGSADLVLAHGLLEVVDDPARVIGALAEAVAPHGAVSVLVANRPAAVLHRALGGRLAEARQLLTAPDGVLPADGDTLLRRFDTAGLRALLGTGGLEPVLLRGDGVVADVLPSGNVPVREDELTEFELAAAAESPLRDIATRLHALARRAGS
ncbi:SAM-dependent methyltransferase [Amycolatopsis antarctica]|uniref:SAM-dependent methyltransferase n=1 Tax=Amycolatopsis antarctica TaxID=1854586 RepID=A0A263D7G9_9PSEU|nr:methyltransferase domain-containing protein [Amycolatopsis antarctica]OZM74420.1 SAM-dependent methyltransferase [Amycolatopsis antarctica]